MPKPFAINILVCQNAKLGPPDGLGWLQKNISVPYWRVYWDNAPGAFIKDGSGEIELLPDLVAAIPPRTVYSTRAERATLHFYTHFTAPEPFESAMPGIRVFRNARLAGCASEISAELSRQQPGARTMLKVQRYLCEILLSIPERDIPEERLSDPRIEAATAIVDEEPGVSIGELAGRLNMSRSALVELFKRNAACAPQRFFRRRRLEKASVLLHFSDKTIKQIAEETGFCDRYHLSRLFKREFSCGPAEFRRQFGELR